MAGKIKYTRHSYPLIKHTNHAFVIARIDILKLRGRKLSMATIVWYKWVSLYTIDWLNEWMGVQNFGHEEKAAEDAYWNNCQLQYSTNIQNTHYTHCINANERGLKMFHNVHKCWSAKN